MSLKFRQAFIVTIFHPCAVPSPNQSRRNGYRSSQLQVYRFNSKPLSVGCLEANKLTPSMADVIYAGRPNSDVISVKTTAEERRASCINGSASSHQLLLLLRDDASTTNCLSIPNPNASSLTASRGTCILSSNIDRAWRPLTKTHAGNRNGSSCDFRGTSATRGGGGGGTLDRPREDIPLRCFSRDLPPPPSYNTSQRSDVITHLVEPLTHAQSLHSFG